jgi:hypothetical protein
MFTRKVNLYALLLIALTACTKQEIILSSASSALLRSDTSYAAAQQQMPLQTTFGLIEENATDDQTKADMKEANVNIVRLTIFLSQTTVGRTIDDYLAQGYNVQISISWFTGTNTNRGFPGPKDTSLVRSQANAFFQYYTDRKKQISFVSIENEWDHEVQSGANLQDYINELAIMTSVGHKYGFKIADGGITYASLQRWTYSQLTGTAQQQWKLTYYVGLNNDYDGLLNMVNTYIAAVKKISFDYSNVHWYNTAICGNGYGTASQTFMIACNKKTPVCNEFGVRTNSLTLFTQTVDEITGYALYAVAYSGTNKKGKAVKLTDPMLQVLATS